MKGLEERTIGRKQSAIASRMSSQVSLILVDPQWPLKGVEVVVHSLADASQDA